MDLQQYLADISLKTMSQLHRAIVHLTGGQVPGQAFGVPVVECTRWDASRASRGRPCSPRRSSRGTGWCWWPSKGGG
jgi:hypothetical protein